MPMLMLADRPAVAASLNRDLAKIQEWCNHWCMILKQNKALGLRIHRTANPPRFDLVLSGVFALVPTSTFLV